MTDSDEQPSPDQIRAFAFRLLGRREYSRAELKARLERKWPGATELGELVEALSAEGLVSDERYADSFVRTRLHRSQGPLKIKAILRAKGVGDDTIDRALADYEDRWTELATDWLRRQQTGPLDFDDRRKYYRRLVNRGFSHAQAMDAINAL